MYHKIYKEFWPERVIEQKNKTLLSQLNRLIVYMIVFNLCLIPFSYNKYLDLKQQIEEKKKIQMESKSVVEEGKDKKQIDFSAIEKISKLVSNMNIKDFSYEDNTITFIGNYDMLDFYLKYFAENNLELVNVDRQNEKDSRFAVRII
ncbi:hypothetical protein [Clostridium folliculivorans]|uniref:Uncharacterized protein n=1 Tax=Clostridium folliculivorans TaxID=2886038 RepID=A0A9W5XZS4_9CLOT|nr:hypothetical protein [Clostridium folliculivorans]GKU23983.1 hypothetical protein CFOLD11_08090 [Clostridium folliculivorans]GKU30098.1 hypothetical protein CFB3_22050 [Clostridium folliculivorans]